MSQPHPRPGDLGLRRFYRVGISIGLLIALGGFLISRLGWASSLPSWAAPHWVLFAYSLTHVLLLAGRGGRVPIEECVLAGGRIQTAGYLYALLGFGAALAGLRDDSSLAEITPGLMGALFTSVLGWFFGGEVASCASNDPIGGATGSPWQAVIDGARTSEAEIEDLRARQAKLAERLVATSTYLADCQDKAAESLAGLIKRFGTVDQVVAQHWTPDLAVTLSRLGERAATLAGSLKQASESGKEVAQYLSQSRVLIVELGQLLGAVADERAEREIAAQSQADALRRAVDPLITQLQAVEARLATFAADRG